MKTLPENSVGLKCFSYWCDFGKTLHEQLTEANIPYETVDIPHLIGMGGSAYFTFYRSPKTHKSITVLCIPIRYDIDGFAEEYYYFDQISRDEALADEQYWLKVYRECKKLVRQLQFQAE